MSTQWLPNVTRILAAARTYKRACGAERKAHRDLAALPKEKRVGSNAHERCLHAITAKETAGRRLLWFIETGEKSLAKMKP